MELDGGAISCNLVFVELPGRNSCDAGVCRAWGHGTHVFSFDGTASNVFGAGKYQLLETTSAGIPYVQVSMTTTKGNGSPVSSIKITEIKFSSQNNLVLYTVRLSSTG